MDDNALELDETSRAIIDREMAEGRFDSPGDVVRSALLPFQQRDFGLAALRQAIDDGDSSGEPIPFDFATFIDAKSGAGSLPR